MQIRHSRQGRAIDWPEIPGWDYPESIIMKYYKPFFAFWTASYRFLHPLVSSALLLVLCPASDSASGSTTFVSSKANQFANTRTPFIHLSISPLAK